MKPTILISSDNTVFLDFLDYLLEAEGFDTRTADGPEQAFHIAVAETPDLAVIDCRAGPEPALNFCTRLRRSCLAVVDDGPEWRNGAGLNGTWRGGALTVVAITDAADDETEARLRSARLDECIAGPPPPAELVRRLRAVLARCSDTGAKRLAYAGIEIDLSGCQVLRDGKPVGLGATEFRLLHRLLEQPEKVFSRDELVDRAWTNGVDPGSRTVDVHIGRLRKALNAESKPDLIRTVRPFGYVLSNGDDEDPSE